MFAKCLVWLCCLLPLMGHGQENQDEYYVPSKKKRIYPWLKNPALEVIPLKYFFSLEGAVRQDKTELSNTLGNLIQKQDAGSSPWGLMIGAMYNNRWLFETGYYSNAVQSYTYVTPRSFNAPPFRWKAKLNSIPLRVKRKLFSIGRFEKESGFYWEVGAMGLIPDNAGRIGSFTYKGLVLKGAGLAADTVFLKNQTYAKDGLKILIETGLDLNVKLARGLDVGFFVRGTLGFSNILESQMSFSGAGYQTLTAIQNSKGTGYYFGMNIRYNYLFREQYKSKLNE